MLGVGRRRAPAGETSSPSALAGSLRACLAGLCCLRGASAGAGQVVALFLAERARLGDPLVGPLLLSLVAGVYFAPVLLLSPALGALADRYGPRPLMLLAALAGGVGIALLAVAPVLPLVLLARMLDGLSAASSTPAVMGYLTGATAHSAGLRGRVMSRYEVATVIGFAFGFVAAGALWDQMGTEAFAAIAAVYAASLLAFLLVGGPAPLAVSRRLPLHAYLVLLRQAAVVRFLPVWLASNAVIGVLFAQVTFNLAGTANPDQFLMGGYSGTQISAAFGLFGLVFILGALLWGQLFTRLAAFTVLLLGIGGTFLVVAALFALNHSGHSAPALLPPLLALALGGVVLQAGFPPAALVYLAGIAEADPAQRGAILGLYAVGQGVGMLLGGGLAGGFAERLGFDGLLLFTALLGVVALAGLAAMRAWERRHVERLAGGQL